MAYFALWKGSAIGELAGPVTSGESGGAWESGRSEKGESGGKCR